MTTKQYEEKGRMKLEKLLNASRKIKSYLFSTNRYDRYDCTSTGTSGELTIFEIKDRQIPSDKYDTILLERGKYDAMGLRHIRIADIHLTTSISTRIAITYFHYSK